MATSLVDFLKSQDIEGAEMLEVGGGIGAIQVELLKAGVARSVNVELSSGYDDAARELAEDEGLDDRITRKLGDFVEQQHEVETADIVVMNKVVCCYPWAERMMDAAVAKTGRYLALVFPRGKWWVKFGVGSANRFMQLRKCDFRSFVHPVTQIEAAAMNEGLVARHTDRNLIWNAVVFERAA